MKSAFLFPGQGSQSIGMGKDLYDNFSSAKAVFDEVDEALHEKLSDLIFNGEATALTQTENAQPAIMTVGMAAVRALESELGQPITNIAQCVAGHSLGEYTALCAAGVFSIAQTAQLLRIRGQAMGMAAQETTGTMAAILGLTFPVLQDIVTSVSTPSQQVVIANDNCPGQLVISGHTDAVEAVMQQATEAGARRALKLQVSGAFHSPYMRSAAEKMQEVLDEMTLADPLVPVVANYTATFETSGDDIKKNLVNQVTGSVRWTESAQLMLDKNIDTFVECGNGKVITGLMKRMAKGATLLSVGDSASLSETLAQLSAKI